MDSRRLVCSKVVSFDEASADPKIIMTKLEKASVESTLSSRKNSFIHSGIITRRQDKNTPLQNQMRHQTPDIRSVTEILNNTIRPRSKYSNKVVRINPS